MSGYTVFISYVLVPISGFSQAIHCNYIKSLQLITANLSAEEIRINFPNTNDFKFLNSGYTANKVYALIQVVSGVTSGTTIIKPNVANWKMIDVSNQISGYTGLLTATQLTSVVFKIPLLLYNTYPTYNLNYLNYPSSLPIDDDKLCFGDETYFLGNVTADIHADVYTTDPQIILNAGEFNSSTNATWDGISSVAITEIGIYDSNKNLVAIGKLNNPIIKNTGISRTISFAIDF
jgi:hypothetical protein